MPIPKLKTGDIIAFSGNTFLSDSINVLSLGIPRWSIAHVGILAPSRDFHSDDRYGGLVLYEALMKPGPRPCLIQREKKAGVQAQLLTPYLREDHGPIWHYPLSRRLYDDEQKRLWTFLQAQVGKQYDLDGAIHAGGVVYALANALFNRGASGRLNSLFCSEVTAGAHNEVGIFPTGNISRWSPNKFCRRERWMGILKKPSRIDGCLA